MAAMKLDPKVLNYNEMNSFKLSTLSFIDDADGVLVPMEGDGRMMIVAMNGTGSEQTVTLKKGTGPMGAAQDKTAAMANGELIFMAVESGLYGQTEGENRGYIHVTASSGDLQMGCFRLPE
ncbi:MAG: hypothetical protein J6B40_07195 [Oscillospiraceae bacterium]|nr:hypothetical protein [Oscillospiraceae bacterium]MBQ8670862.1 hypothetical protein [Oscillospiraceae bacterium]